MHLLFIDESGHPPSPAKSEGVYLVMAGLIVPEERWSGLRSKLLGLKRRKGYRGELKWRYFAPKNDDKDNPMQNWDREQRNLFRSDVFKIISENRSIKVIAGISEAKTAYGLSNINSADDLYFQTYKPITERFQYFLQDITRTSGRETLGLIVADHRGAGNDDGMRERHERLTRESKQHTSAYSNFVETLFFAPSHMSIGIQLVDMVAGAIWRAQTHKDFFWFNKIKSSFRTNPAGKIDGFGIARFPKQGWQGNILD